MYLMVIYSRNYGIHLVQLLRKYIKLMYSRVMYSRNSLLQLQYLILSRQTYSSKTYSRKLETLDRYRQRYSNRKYSKQMYSKHLLLSNNRYMIQSELQTVKHIDLDLLRLQVTVSVLQKQASLARVRQYQWLTM